WNGRCSESRAGACPSVEHFYNSVQYSCNAFGRWLQKHCSYQRRYPSAKNYSVHNSGSIGVQTSIGPNAVPFATACPLYGTYADVVAAEGLSAICPYDIGFGGHN